MFSGIVSGYSTVGPEFVYPQKYYLIQELTGNSIYFYQNTASNNIANIYSARNPISSANVLLDHGVITFDEVGKTLIVDTRSSTLQNKTIEYFVNTTLTTNTFSNTHLVLTNTAGNVLFRMQPSIETNATRSIIVSHKNSTGIGTTINNVSITSANWASGIWNHIAFSSEVGTAAIGSRFYVYLNGTRVHTSTSNIFDFNTNLQLRLSCNTLQTYYSDIRITNENLYPGGTNFTVPMCPLQPASNTIILLSGNFDPTRFRTNVVSTVSPLTLTHPTSLGTGSAVFTGYLEMNTINKVDVATSATPPAGSKIGIVIGNDGTRKQEVVESTTASAITRNISAQGNSYAPFYVYISSSGGACSLNDRVINLPRISNAQLANSFTMCNTDGEFLKNTSPDPKFTSIGGVDTLRLRPSSITATVAVANVLAGNTYLVDQLNRFIGYTASNRTFTTGSVFEWNFVPLGGNRFGTAAGDVFIFLK
jgi:hypothetical protein